MTTADFSAAGFVPCATPPPCWQQEPGNFYTRTQAHGAAFVRYLAGTADPHSARGEEIEAFVGDWHQPWAYWCCWGCGITVAQLLRRLGS